MPQYIDLSRTIQSGMPVYPGDRPVELEQIASFQEEGHSNFLLTTGMHAGTHIDGPMHLSGSLIRISDLPISHFACNGYLLNVVGQKTIHLQEQQVHHLPPGSALLLYTGFDSYFDEKAYYEAYPALSEESAHLLANKQIRMIGMDSPSPDYAPFNVHKILMEKQILIIENLTNLAALTPFKEFELLAFPLKLRADSSPVRVVARISDRSTR
ncbi:MAG: cyclase family protein [Marinilabiliales bacterium]|nr:cyclase family protein [Marinilabiliales bacterium]